jgi:lipoprotein-releasing system ATP-binding protein
MENSIVDVKNLVKDYKSGVETLHILRSLNFKIEKGSSVAIRGTSGSGKSTLLNIIGGLDHFDSGSCNICGNDIGKLSENQLTNYRRNNVGFIFQFHYLLKDFTALENVMLPAFISGLDKKTALEKARALLDDVQLGERIEHFPAKLSGGERQRVAVARSMINDPDLILADEPTGNLDGENSTIVADLLYGNAEKRAKTLIVVTHDEKIADRAKTQHTLTNGVLE